MTETAQYHVKAHEEAFTDLEITLRREIEAVLPEDERHYRTDENLESLKNYRKNNRDGTFIPSDHYYLFAGDEFVGFIHTWPQDEKTSQISIPFAKNGYEDAGEFLYSHLREDLKSRGFEKMILAPGYLNSMALEWGEKHGFVKEGINSLNATLVPTETKIESTNTFTVRDYTPDDQEQVIQLYISQGYERERVENQFTSMNRDMLESDLKISWIVAEKDGKVVGHTFAAFNGADTKEGYMNAVTNNVPDEDKSNLFADMYAKHLENAREKGATSLSLGILPLVVHLRKFYEEIGLEFTETYAYGKSI